MNDNKCAGGCRPQRDSAKDYYFFLAAFFVAFFFVATHITSSRAHVLGYGLSSYTQTVVTLVLAYFFFAAFFAAFFFAAIELTSFRGHISPAIVTAFQTTDRVRQPIV